MFRAPTTIEVLGTLVGLFLVTRIFKKRRLPLPPGPKGLPLLGNVLDIPAEKPWLALAKLGKTWGDICSITILGQTMIIINSLKIAEELLHKRGLNYSDRPILTMGGKLVGLDNSLILAQYGDRFRRERKLFHQLFGTHTSIKQLHPVLEEENLRLLQRILHNPEDFTSSIRKTTGAVVLRISHGYKIKEEPETDPFIESAKLTDHHFSQTAKPGAFLVDILPILQHVPSWFPGAGFKKTAQIWKKDIFQTVDEPHKYVKQQMAAGTAPPSFTSTLLTERPDEDYLIKWAAASIYAAGSGTTSATIEAFILSMVLHPEAQAKAQAEIDAVVGNSRLPELADRERLPYVNALCKEVHRWHCVAPSGMPHRVTQDDTYEGYFIPKGALVIANTWTLAHDESTYHDPMTFNPDRFLNTQGKEPEQDPFNICFGFGRRICPGMHLADALVFTSCVMMLAAFNISKKIEDGLVIEPVFDQTSGTVSHVVPFQCSITPRSQRAVVLIQEGH